MSRLSNASKKVNWNRLLVKGAIGHLAKVAGELSLRGDDLISLEKTILKLETLMLNKLAEDYEAYKATELYARQLDNLLPTTKKIIEHIKAHKIAGFNNIASQFIYHKEKQQVVKELTSLGYKAKELKVGNTFLITWPSQ